MTTTISEEIVAGPGVYTISNEAYHAGPGVSKSTLDLARKAPALVQWSKHAPRSQSDAANLGTALHALLLEPETFDQLYAVGPDCDRRSNANKARWEEFEASLGNRHALSIDDRDKLEEMRQSALAHPEVAAILGLKSGRAEQSVYWIDQRTGLLCRCRPDWWSQPERLVADLKTTDDITKFHWSARDYRYDVQEAFYTDGLAAAGFPIDFFVFIVVGKKRAMGRYPVEVIELNRAAVDRSSAEYREDLDTIADCMRTGHWPGVQSMTVPPRYQQ